MGEIEGLAKNLHSSLFDPEISRPIKTLDLPLGGPKGIRTALQVLIDFILIATRNQQGYPKKIEDMPDDPDGTATIAVLRSALALARRITGNDGGSLGLHPAVYFYGPTGRHSGPMFMGTVYLIGSKLSNNDKEFFRQFTHVRSKLEAILIDQKDLIATILQKHVSPKRVAKYGELLDGIINQLNRSELVSEGDLVKLSGLDGKVVVGAGAKLQPRISDDVKSVVFIRTALSSAIKCPLCDGYLDPEKSVSYDHIVRAREQGRGQAQNVQLTHPYCNQSMKN